MKKFKLLFAILSAFALSGCKEQSVSIAIEDFIVNPQDSQAATLGLKENPVNICADIDSQIANLEFIQEITGRKLYEDINGIIYLETYEGESCGQLINLNLQKETFSIFNESFDYVILKDNNSVYECSYRIKNTCRLLEEINSQAFEAIDNFNFKDDQSVYTFCYTHGSGTYLNVENADPKTFEFIEDSYVLAKDKDNIYYQGGSWCSPWQVIGIKPQKLEVIGNCLKNDEEVFCCGREKCQKINIEDPQLFQQIDTRFYKYKNQIYHLFFDYSNDLKISHLKGDPATFVNINDYYSKDSKQVYEHYPYPFGEGDIFQILNNADPDSFTASPKDGSYGKDKNYVYHVDEIIEKSDPDTCEFCEELFTIDENDLVSGEVRRVRGWDDGMFYGF
jgi:hypothetical protein